MRYLPTDHSSLPARKAAPLLRPLRGLAFLLLMGLLPAASLASTPASGTELALESLRASLDGTGSVSLETGETRTLRLRGSLLGVDPSQKGARAFLKSQALLLQLGDSSLLKATPRVQGRGGLRLAFDRYEAGRRVVGGELLLGFDRSGALIWLTHSWPAKIPFHRAGSLSAARATALASASLAGSEALKPGAVERVLVRGNKKHPGWHEAFQVALSGRGPEAPFSDWIYVDAFSGEILKTHQRLQFAGTPCAPCNASTDVGCGRLFFAGPVDALNDTSLRDASNVDAALSDCQLPHLESPSRLTGTFANTSITGNRLSPPYDPTRSADEPGVDEVTGYFQVTRAHDFLAALGYGNVMNFSLPVSAHDPQVGNNAYYDPQSVGLHFGTDGIDFAQDPDVIYHEYGHGIQDNMVPGWGQSQDTGSMGEGFGDYMAGAISDDIFAVALGPACLSSWVSAFFSPYNGTPGSGCLRRMDTEAHFPETLFWEVHEDGKIWSRGLWTMRLALGGPKADAIVIEAHTLMGPAIEFRDAADALVAADASLNGGANKAAIDQAMFEAGLPRSDTAGDPATLNGSSSYRCETPHAYRNNDYMECRFTAPGATALRFHFSRFETEAAYDFVRISDAMFNEVELIDGAPFGSGGGNSATVKGDTIVARFRTDPGVKGWGFAIDRVEWNAASCTASAECDDGIFCNGAELCNSEGFCKPGTLPAEDDGVACTRDLCVEATKSFSHEPVDARCDDGRFCNGQEVCDLSADCTAGTPPAVDDGVECTQDVCVENRKVIEHLPRDLFCEDNVACNGPEVCDLALGCQHELPPGLDDGVPCTVDDCDPTTGAPTHTPDDTRCDDGVFCNGTGICDAVTDCQAGTGLVVDDGISCTADSCDEAAREVLHVPDASLCDDGLFCNGVELCDLAADCQAGEAPVVDDGLTCTVDACDEATQQVTHEQKRKNCKEGKGCGCSASSEGGEMPLALLALGLVGWVGRRRRRGLDLRVRS